MMKQFMQNEVGVVFNVKNENEGSLLEECKPTQQAIVLPWLKNLKWSLNPMEAFF
jgi:hypothetical protein